MKQIRVLNANRATHALLGTTPETDVSQVLHRVFRRDAFPAFGEGMGAIHQGQPRFSAQTRMYTLGGDAREIIMSWVVAPDAIDDYKRVIASVLDITAQHQAAEEMRLAVRTAEEANRAKSSFLANTSHEIRTPINAIMGMAQALLEESLTQVAEDQVDTILNASEALSRIIDDLLDLSKIEAGELDLESIRFDLAEVIEDVRRTVVGGATAKGLVLAINVAPETETDVVGDPVRIRQILLNLLANAIKFTQTGAVRVAISSQRQGPSVIFRCEVEDSGIGISADRLTDIFDPFTQADGSTTRLHGGTGLGLSISKRLVELMDGRIDVESRPGVGSTFRFSVRLLAAQGKVDSSASVPEPTPTDVSPLRILVAEDNELNLKVVRALLRSDRHGIEEVVNGQQAVEASQQKGPYDVILMDIQMPVMDGITATKMIREHEASTGAARTPIVALTANAMESDRERCMAAGMDDFVPKPVRKRALQHVLAQIASGAQSTKAAIATPVKEQGSKVIDPAPLDELRHLAALDPDFSIKSFVELFLIEAPKSLADAYTALQEADLEALHRHVHTLKGSAREVGAVKLGEAAQSLEALLNVGDTTNSLQQLRQLETLLGEASQALQKLAAEE